MEIRSIAGIIPWVVIAMYFLGAVTSGDAKPPARQIDRTKGKG